MLTHEGETYQEKAIRLVRNHIVVKLEKTDPWPRFDVYVVWFSKTLQNWKALVSTTLPDGMYYEVTYNGNKKETYIDAYKKFDNVCVRDGDVDPNEFVDKYSVPRISDSTGVQYGNGNNQVNTFQS